MEVDFLKNFCTATIVERFLHYMRTIDNSYSIAIGSASHVENKR